MDHSDGRQAGLSRLVADNEIAARIYNQCCVLQPKEYLAKAEVDQFWITIIDLMKKLERCKYHVQRCNELVATELARPRVAKPGLVEADHTSGIEAEVEAFLFQAKSSLDLLAKVLHPVAGIKMRTFGENGQSVMRALRNNLKEDRRHRATRLIQLIEEDAGWLRQLVSLRDTIGHFRAIESTGVTFSSNDNLTDVREPIGADGVPFSKLLQILYYNLLTFCEDFVALALNLAMPAGLEVLVVAPSERADPSNCKFVIAATGSVVPR